MSATGVLAARSFAIKTWLLVTISIAVFLGQHFATECFLWRALFASYMPIINQALKPGYYYAADEDLMFYRILATADTADQKLDLGTSLDEIDIGIGTYDADRGRHVVYFTRDQLHGFLKKQMKKDLLSIRMWQASKEELQSLRNFVSDLGYKRVLILGNQCEGVYVLYDSAGAGFWCRPERKPRHT